MLCSGSWQALPRNQLKCHARRLITSPLHFMCVIRAGTLFFGRSIRSRRGHINSVLKKIIQKNEIKEMKLRALFRATIISTDSSISNNARIYIDVSIINMHIMWILMILPYSIILSILTLRTLFIVYLISAKFFSTMCYLSICEKRSIALYDTINIYIFLWMKGSWLVMVQDSRKGLRCFRQLSMNPVRRRSH